MRGRGAPGPRAAFWLTFAFFTLLGSVWALASPLSAAPDEASHLSKAGGVVRGQLLGSEYLPGRHVVALPELFGDVGKMNDCFAFRPDFSAACMAEPDDFSAEPVAVLTTAGRYNPVYYVIVGAPTLLPPSLASLYLVRLASVLLCAATLGMAVRSAVESRARTWAVVGVTAAVTPMVVFLLSTVNPSAVEITAGVGLWATLLAALRDPQPDLVLRRMLRAGVLVALLVNAKALSPVFLAIIVLTAVACAPWARTRALLTDRRAWPGLALGTAASAVAVVWVRLAGAVAQVDEPPFPDLTPGVAFDRVLARSDQYVANMIGQFGTVDTGLPLWGYVLGGTLVLLPVLLALAVGTVRERIVLGALALVVAALPVVLQVPQATVLGLPWQGRYVLPVAVGLPVIAGFVLATHRSELGTRITRGVVGLVAGIWGVMQLLGLVANIRRYTVGADWPFLTPRDDATWVPPLGEPVLLLLGAALCVAGVVLVRRLAALDTLDAPPGPDRVVTPRQPVVDVADAAR